MNLSPKCRVVALALVMQCLSLAARTGTAASFTITQNPGFFFDTDGKSVLWDQYLAVEEFGPENSLDIRSCKGSRDPLESGGCLHLTVKELKLRTLMQCLNSGNGPAQAYLSQVVQGIKQFQYYYASPPAAMGATDSDVHSYLLSCLRRQPKIEPSYTTIVGIKYTLVDKLPSEFGACYRDPSDLIWCDLARDARNEPLVLSHDEAEKHCAGLDSPKFGRARLPSQIDQFRLRESMSQTPAREFFENDSWNPNFPALPGFSTALSEAPKAGQDGADHVIDPDMGFEEWSADGHPNGAAYGFQKSFYGFNRFLGELNAIDPAVYANAKPFRCVLGAVKETYKFNTQQIISSTARHALGNAAKQLRELQLKDSK